MELPRRTFRPLFFINSYSSLPYIDSENIILSSISMAISVFIYFIPFIYYIYNFKLFDRIRSLSFNLQSLNKFYPMDYALLVATPPSLVIGLFFPIHGGAREIVLLWHLYSYFLYSCLAELKNFYDAFTVLDFKSICLISESLLSGRYLLSSQHLDINDPGLINRFNQIPKY